MSEWKPCIKRPVIVHVREKRPGEKHVSTREGITPVKHDDLIMRGISGEEYPIGRAIFEQTYDFADEATRTQPAQVPRMTDEEIHNADPMPHVMFDTQRLEFARAIEAALLKKMQGGGA